MDEKEKYYIWLTQIPQIGIIAQKKLLEHFGNPNLVYEADEQELSKVDGLNHTQLRNIITEHNLDKAQNIIDQCKRHNIKLLTWDDALYPNKSKVDICAPILLYTKGTICPDKLKKSVGIVGARRCTQADKQVTIETATSYVERGYSVVSGMAKGVDSYGHTVCLNNNGYTVAVLGNGLDICYPKEHLRLMESIEEHGLLLSEYPPGTRPQRYNFPRRNRIISGWSDELIVVAPGKKSGSLITARYSHQLGRDVIIMNSESNT